MNNQALFSGLIFDERDRLVETVLVGDEPCYVVDDDGFHRHIPSQQVDRQVLGMMRSQIEGNEDLLSEQAAKMLGQEDIFSKAALEQQFKHIDQQFDKLFETGIPEEGRAYMGMLGFKIVIDVHGEVIDVKQPSAAADEGDE
jgi:hypothetical protein